MDKNSLPKSWQKYKFEDVLQYEQPTKYLVKSTKYSDEYTTPVLTAGKSFILGYTNETDGIFQDTPVIIFDDFTTATKFVNFKFKVKSSAMKILRPTQKADIKFLFYLMQIIQIRAETHKRYWISDYSKREIYLPSVAEQREIVGEIERRFEKLDKAIENFRQILKNLKLYRQSVLKFAFDGKFTNPNLTNWQTKPLGEVVSKNKHSIKRGPFGSSLKKEFFVSNGIRIFEQYNPINQDPNFKRYFITEEKFKELEAFMACGGDLLISCSGTIGKILELPQNVEKGIINQALLKITLDNEKILNSFFVLFFQSPKMQKEILENTIGTAIKNIVGVKELKQIQIPIPPLSEQKQIVSEIEKRFAKADKIENLINKSLKNAEILKQSILKQAFSGNLKVKK